MIISTIIGRTNHPSGLHVRIDRMTGFLPFRVHIHHLELHDRLGPWLTLKNLSWQWDFKGILKGRFRMQEILIDSIIFIRFPETRKTKAKRLNQYSPWLWFLQKAEIYRFELNYVAIAAPVFIEPAVFRLEGHLKTPTRGAKKSTRIKSASKPGTS